MTGRIEDVVVPAIDADERGVSGAAELKEAFERVNFDPETVETSYDSLVLVDTVTSPGSALLGALRGVLAESDDALLCVAFAQARGVHLIAREVAEVARRGRARVLVTNVFGTTSEVALGALREAGASVRVLSLRECSLA